MPQKNGLIYNGMLCLLFISSTAIGLGKSFVLQPPPKTLPSASTSTLVARQLKMVVGVPSSMVSVEQSGSRRQLSGKHITKQGCACNTSCVLGECEPTPGCEIDHPKLPSKTCAGLGI